MKFNINIPSKIISGESCIKTHASELTLGKNAFIVTGKSGAKKSGALDDVLSILSENLIKYCIFDKIGENPAIEVCFEAGKLCSASECDFVIAIGGGSVIDAAKAIAAYGTNDIKDENDIFDESKLPVPSLPIVAIPTTAGTGSEANYYSVLTLEGGRQKKTFKSVYSWPRVSFLDPRYTYSLPKKYTVSCALDALAHSIESYLSPKSDVISENFSIFAAKNILDVLSRKGDEFSADDREKLLYAASAAGVAISITGTGFPHPLGYSLSLLDSVPHGMACAVFEGDYIAKNMLSGDGKTRLESLFSQIGYSADEVSALTLELADCNFTLTEDEIAEHIDLVEGAANYSNSPYVIDRKEMFEIYRSHFLAK